MTLQVAAPRVVRSQHPLLRASICRAIRNISTGGMDPVEAQEARAQELEALGLPRIAGWIKGCGTDYPWCRQRLCPRCSERTARRRRKGAAFRIRAMAHPVFFTLAVPIAVGDAVKLAEAIRKFRLDIFRVRRNVCFAPIRRAEGSIELRLSDDGRRWLVHAHLALDAPRGWNWRAAARRWTELTRPPTTTGGSLPGRMLPHPRWPVIESRSVWPVAKYVTKSTGWCPAPGSLPLARLDEWRQAIRSVRLPVSWGGGEAR